MMKEIPGFSRQYVTEDGRIFSSRSGELRGKKQRIDTKGYLRVMLRDDSHPVKYKSMNVHTAVLLAFVGPRPDGMGCRHLNGNCLDNRLSNLCWGTHQENIQDEIRHGTAACLRKGERSFRAKLHTIDIYVIRKLVEMGYSETEVGNAFKISQRHVSDIYHKKTWKHLI